MKRSNSLFAKQVVAVMFFMLLHQFTFATFRDIVNLALNDYVVPLIILVVILGAVYGFIRNQEKFKDDNHKKEALLDIALTVVVVFIVVAAIAGVVAYALNIKIAI